jgi:hypothetical protein
VSDGSVGLLRERVEELDTGPLPVVPSDADPRLLHFVSVMSSCTDTAMAARSSGPARLVPADADRIAGSCRLLEDLARDEGGLVGGPLDREGQHWIGTGRHASAPVDVAEPARSRFVEPRAAGPAQLLSPKPFGLGLYTSTATRAGPSMWRIYLDSYYGSDLYPLPWYTWKLGPAPAEVRVLEIAGAGDWASFVERYATAGGGLLYPDWLQVARDLDAVHVTPRAVVAAQGFSFPVAGGVTAPAFWDVETTLWLRWCFRPPALLEVTR